MSRHRKQRLKKQRQRRNNEIVIFSQLDQICLEKGEWPFEHLKISEIADKFVTTGIKRPRRKALISEYVEKCEFKVVAERAF